jgi:hypothetical protein
MTVPRPASRPWTLTDDDMLRKLLASGMKAPAIALKINRTLGAIQSRKSKLKGSAAKPTVKALHRQLMQYLRSGDWKIVAKLPIVASDYMLIQLIGNGWIEQRGDGAKAEIKITKAGLLALQTPV